MKTSIWLAAAGLLALHPALAGPGPIDPRAGLGGLDRAEIDQDLWERLNDWSIGGILFPHLHLHGIGGFSTGDPDALAVGGHDPRREDPSVQAIEPGLSLRTKYLEGFANGVFFQDAGGDWDGELEEAFGKIIDLPGGFEIRGGQFLARFGQQNNRHLHAWNFVDQDLALARFLGDDGLIVRGGGIDWTLPLGTDPVLVPVLSVSYGDARPHTHDHGEEEHDGEEHGIEAEELAPEDDIWTIRMAARYRFTDFHSLTGGVSWAGGENGFGADSHVYGADLEWLWRERGLEPGGRAFRWRVEGFLREADYLAEDTHGHHDEHEHDHDHEDHAFDEHGFEEHGGGSGSVDEFGLTTSAIFTWNDHLDTGLRLDWVEGDSGAGLDERLRLSPVLTYWLDSGRRIGLRAQYNYDRIDGGQDEHGVWFQVGIALGSTSEVR